MNCAGSSSRRCLVWLLDVWSCVFVCSSSWVLGCVFFAGYPTCFFLRRGADYFGCCLSCAVCCSNSNTIIGPSECFAPSAVFNFVTCQRFTDQIVSKLLEECYVEKMASRGCDWLAGGWLVVVGWLVVRRRRWPAASGPRKRNGRSLRNCTRKSIKHN